MGRRRPPATITNKRGTGRQAGISYPNEGPACDLQFWAPHEPEATATRASVSGGSLCAGRKVIGLYGEHRREIGPNLKGLPLPPGPTVHRSALAQLSV